jgi:anti-sigma B factor antagonist
MANPTDVALEQVGDTSVIALLGEHDLSTGDRIQVACDRAWEHGPRIVFDLTGTTFLDSSVLGVMVRTLRRAQESGGFVAVVAPDGTAGARVIGLIGIGDMLPVHQTRGDALRAAGEPA